MEQGHIPSDSATIHYQPPGNVPNGAPRRTPCLATKSKDADWNPDAMILNAWSLQATARQLVSDPDPRKNEPPSDTFHHNGRFFAGPILLALATEIALKAWQCRERAGAPDRTHDLVALFEKLSQEAQDILETRCPKGVIPPALEVFGPIPSGMRGTLELHRNTFVSWRYAYEATDDHIWPDALDAALTAILEAYERPQA